MGILVKPNGDFTSNLEEMVQVWFDVHFPGSIMIPAPNEEPRVWSDPEVFVQPLEWISGERFINLGNKGRG